MKKKRILTIILIAIILLGGSLLYNYLASPQVPPSPYVTEFQTKNSSLPNAIAVDGQGRVWFSLWNETALSELFPSNGTVRTFPLPESGNPGLETWGVATESSRGLVFFTDHISNAIWSFNMSSHKFVKYAVPTSGSFPYQIVLDGDGNAWFTESFGGKLGELTSNGIMNEYQVPENGSAPDPTGIAIDNGTLWFTEPDDDMIGSFTSGTFRMFNVSGLIYSPVGIAIDPKGNLWVTQHTYPGLVSEFDPFTHFLKTFATSYPTQFGTSLPYFIYSDSGGDLWFNEHYGNAIGFFNPRTGSLLEYHVAIKNPIPGNLSGILTMTLSSSGVPYFTELFTGDIGMINASIPPPQKLTVLSAGGVNSIPIGSSVNVSVSVAGSGQSYLSAYIGNFTQSLKFSFTVQSGTGNFSSTLTIQNKGAPSGIYMVTISDRSLYVTTSRLVEISVP